MATNIVVGTQKRIDYRKELKNCFINYFVFDMVGAAHLVDLDLKKALHWVESDFTLRWGRIHRCKLPGCGDTCIADGHTDYRRPICANQENPTYVTHDAIKNGGYYQGCTNSPSHRSIFCEFCKRGDQQELVLGRGTLRPGRQGASHGCIVENAQDEVAWEDSCNTLKDKANLGPRHLTNGALYNVWPCQICFAMRELFKSEGYVYILFVEKHKLKMCITKK